MREIIGNTTATPNPRPDWNQTDETKADYIKNKPALNEYAKLDELLQILEQAKEYTDMEIATFDFIKVVSGHEETGLPLVETPLPNKLYLVPKADAADNDFFDTYIWANKGTEENPEYDWDFQGTKKIEADFANYVKSTDYATYNKAGVVRVSSDYGLTMGGTGALLINGATVDEITAKTAYRKPITADKIDIAVKVGMTTNAEEWTDDEKTSARDLINAVGNTDYASTTKAGIIKLGDAFKTSEYATDTLSLVTPPEGAIDSRAGVYALTIDKIDYAVLQALSDCKIEWTDEQKAAARALLGAVGETELGDIDAALDAILEIQNTLIGGGV